MTSSATSRVLNQHLRRFRNIARPAVATPFQTFAGGGGAPSIVVAAIDSSPYSLARADFFCLGTADQIIINDALALLSATGGSVWLAEGTYSLSSSVLFPTAGGADDLILRGLGRGTKLTATTSLATHMINSNGKDFIGIYDMLLQGTSQTAGHGVRLNQTVVAHIENLHIQEVFSDGINFEANNFRVVVTGCYIEDVGRTGIRGVTNDAKITSNQIEGSTSEGIYLLASSAKTSIVGNSLVSNTTYGLRVDGNDCQFVGNAIQANTSDGVLIKGDSNTLVGNTIRTNGGYGVNLDTNAQTNVVTGNTIHTNTSGEIIDNSTTGDNIIVNNGGGDVFVSPGSDTTAVHVDVAAEIVAITEITAPEDIDELIVEDSSDSDNKKSLKIRNLPFTTIIDGFGEDDLAASLTNSQLYRNIQATQAQLSVVMAFPGDVIGISVASTEARTAGTATFEVFVNDVATGLTTVLDATDTQYASTSQAMNLDAFTVGQRVDVRVTTDGTWAPTTADVEATVHVRHTG